jgi:hypothetical protein
VRLVLRVLYTMHKIKQASHVQMTVETVRYGRLLKLRPGSIDWALRLTGLIILALIYNH